MRSTLPAFLVALLAALALALTPSSPERSTTYSLSTSPDAILVNGGGEFRIALLVGVEYTFEVNSPGNALWFQESLTLGGTDPLEDGPSPNGIDYGTIRWMPTEEQANGVFYIVSASSVKQNVTVEVFPFTTIFTVTLDEAKERFLIDGQPNPELTLLIEWPYTFQVNTPGYPFWIYALDLDNKEAVVNTGVLNNGDDSGTITFTPEFFQRGRALIYRTDPTLNKSAMRGLLTIQEQDESAEVTADGNEAFLFDGKRVDAWDGTVGTIYTMEIDAPGHPFYISKTRDIADALTEAEGVTNNGEDVGEITFKPIMAFEGQTLYFVCGTYPEMSGAIEVRYRKPYPHHPPPPGAPEPANGDDLKAAGYTNEQTLAKGLTAYWKTSDGETLQMAIRGETIGWVGVGWTAGKFQMITSEAIVGWVDATGNVVVDTYNLDDKDEKEINPSEQLDISDVSGSEFNGITTIFFTRAFASGKYPLKDGAKNAMIGAIGSTDSISYHIRRAADQFVIDYTVAHVPITPGLGLRDWHGILMMLAWGVALPLGMLFARYCKARPNALWFKLHVPFQVSGLVLALIAIVLIFVAAHPRHYATVWHGQVGTTIMALAIVQLLSGFFRPHKPDPGYPNTLPRIVFEWVHPWGGRALLLSAFVQVLSGILLIKYPDWVFILYFFWGMLVLGAICFLEMWRCCRKKSADSKRAYQLM